MKKIDSAENPLIKKIASLKLKKYRDRESLYLVEGNRIVEDILRDSNYKKYVDVVIISEENQELISTEPYKEFVNQLVVINNKLTREISDTIVSQGVFAVIRKTAGNLESKIQNYSRILLLDNIADPGNLGTMIRTALAAKFDAVIAFKGTVDFYNPKTIRSTMGAINKIDLFESMEYKSIYSILKENDFTIMAAELHGNRSIYCEFAEEKIALVMGSEARGVIFPESYIDYNIFVPMNSDAESLNVAVAAGIIMYSVNKSKFEK